MAKGDDLQDRLIDFGVAILHLCARLPRTQAGRHIGNQLLRSGTAPAPNYAEARGAESRRDFIHKLGIALKEINETHVWLSMLHRSRLITPQHLTSVQQECIELSRILNASIKTARLP